MRPWRTEHAVAKISLSILTAIPLGLAAIPQMCILKCISLLPAQKPRKHRPIIGNRSFSHLLLVRGIDPLAIQIRLHCPSRRKSCSPSFKVARRSSRSSLGWSYSKYTPSHSAPSAPPSDSPDSDRAPSPARAAIRHRWDFAPVVIESGLQADASPEVSRALGVVGQPFFSLVKVLPGRVAV